MAEEALRRIGELYVLEAEVAGADAADRLALRQREALPRLLPLHDWLKAERLRTANGSGLARAIDYIRSSGGRPSCAMFREAIPPIDNNPVENAIRPITLGRRNWLFTGSERAGCRAAAIQSLLATAKLNGLEPYAWLQDVLESSCLAVQPD